MASGGLRFFVLIGLLAATIPAAIDMYVPALPRVASDLEATTSGTQMTIAVFLVGAAFGQLIFGQLSDVVGRRPALLAALALYVVTSALCALTTSLTALVAIRLLQGIAASAGLAIGRSVVRDLYDVTASAHFYSRLSLIYGMAPTIAPLVGAGILHFTSWPGVFLATSVFGLLLLLGAVLWFPETLPEHERRPRTLAATRRTYGRLLRHRRFVGCALALGGSMAALIAYVATATFVMQDRFGASPQLVAVLFGVNALAMVAANQLNAHLLKRFSPSVLTAAGLGLLLLGAGGAFIVGLTGLGLAALEPCLMCMMASWGFVQANVVAVALADQGAAAGAGSALLGFTQYTLGGVAAPLAGLWGSGEVTPFAGVCLAGAVIAASSAYFLVFRGRREVGIELPEPLNVI